MKNINPLGLFDYHFLLEALSKPGDPLQKLNKYFICYEEDSMHGSIVRSIGIARAL